MKKILATLLAVLMVSAAAFTQSPAELEKVRRASCKIYVGAKWKPQSIITEVNGKILEIKEDRKAQAQGSGTIVGRSLSGKKNKPKWIYWVITAGHLFPEDFNKAEKKAIWLHFFSYEGADKVEIRAASKWWVSKGNVDVAFVGFYSEEELQIMPVATNLPKNMFGTEYIAVGHPFDITPFIRIGRFSTNKPYEKKDEHEIGCGSSFAMGMSGGGMFIMQNTPCDQELRLAAIITGFIGDFRSTDRFGVATRVDGVIALLKKHKKMKFVETAR